MWAEKAKRPARVNETEEETEMIRMYTEMEARKERPRPQSRSTNRALSLIYVVDWKNESIGTVKKALRAEIGKETVMKNVENNGYKTQKPWPDVDAVRHINQYGSPSTPLMEVTCVPEKAKLSGIFFSKRE